MGFVVADGVGGVRGGFAEDEEDQELGDEHEKIGVEGEDTCGTEGFAVEGFLHEVGQGRAESAEDKGQGASFGDLAGLAFVV